MINTFLDWAQMQEGGELSCIFYVLFFFATPQSDFGVTVWIVSTEQLLAWVQNPVPLSQLNSFDPLKCSTPQVNQSICDGIPANEQGLLDRCDFSDFPFFTCVSPRKPTSITSFLMKSHSMVVPWRSLLHQTLIHSKTLLTGSRLATAVSHTVHTPCLSRR
jgi:hypothetical protein